MPFIARWQGKIPAGTTNDTTVMAAIDVLPTIASLCGVKDKVRSTDGLDLSDALMGQPVARQKPVYWEYGVHGSIRPGKAEHVSPQLAMRDGNWKLLCDPGGGNLKLFDLGKDVGETNNVAGHHPKIVTSMRTSLQQWWQEMDAYYAGQ
jgi:arylsulfatase A-like enzyme